MLLEKYDTNSPSVIFPVQNTTTEPVARPSVTKLPKILHIPFGNNQANSSDLFSLNNRSAVLVQHFDKISPNTFENPVGRGPKIYTKNLPDVFISGSAGIRYKRQVGVKERNKGDYAEQPSIEVLTPSSRNTLNKFKLQPFANAAQIGSIQESLSSQKVNSKFDFYLPSMKENIEALAYRSHKNNNEDLPKAFNVPKNENAGMSPTRRSKRIRIRTNIEYGPLLENTNTNTGRNQSKEDELKKQLKQLVVFKKKASNTSESKFFDAKSEGVKLRLMDNLSGSTNSIPILQLNELITLRKMNTTVRNGIVKRMLHVPSFKMFDVLEESIGDISSRENYEIKDWINSWKGSFTRSKHIVRVYSCFWNSPEGCVSIVCDTAKHGSLNDMLDLYGNLPERSIQTVAREILTGLVEIHSKLSKPHGNLTSREIVIDAKGTLKITPGISHHFPNSSSSFNNFLTTKSPRTLEIRPSAKISELRSLSPGDFSQDIFDFGFCLLQCALGDFSVFNMGNALTLENIKQALQKLSHKKKSDACCLIHSEEFIRRALTPNGPRRSHKNGRRYKVAEEIDSSFSSDTPYMSLSDILISMNRFSEGFMSFLCSCLQLNGERRPKAEDLLHNRFLSELHRTKGPQVSFKEFIGLDHKEVGDVLKTIQNEDDKGFRRLGEALRVVFLNRNVKEKFDQMLTKTGKNELEGQKISELASELGMSIRRLKKKLNDCLNELQD